MNTITRFRAKHYMKDKYNLHGTCLDVATRQLETLMGILEKGHEVRIQGSGLNHAVISAALFCCDCDTRLEYDEGSFESYIYYKPQKR